MVALVTSLSAACDSALEPTVTKPEHAPDLALASAAFRPELAGSPADVLEDLTSRLLPGIDVELGAQTVLQLRVSPAVNDRVGTLTLAEQLVVLRATVRKLEGRGSAIDPAELDAVRLALNYLENVSASADRAARGN